MGFIKENIGMVSKILLILFLLCLVGVATFQSTLFHERSIQEDTSEESENETLVNTSEEPIIEEKPLEQEMIKPEKEPEQQVQNVSIESCPVQEELPAELKDLPTDVVDLHRKIANLSKENRILKKTIEDQKKYIIDYRLINQQLEEEIEECVTLNIS